MLKPHHTKLHEAFSDLSSVRHNLTGMSVSIAQEPVNINDDEEEIKDVDANNDKEEVDKGKDATIVQNASQSSLNPAFEAVEVIDRAANDSSSGTCSRWMVTLALCLSSLGLVNMLTNIVYLSPVKHQSSRLSY